MNGAEVMDVGRDALWLTIQLCAPVLLVGLVVGVVIGLFQALTQIQEQTLIYAPKIIAIFVSLLLFLPLMGALLGGFMREIAARIAGMAAGSPGQALALASGATLEADQLAQAWVAAPEGGTSAVARSRGRARVARCKGVFMA